MKSIFILVLPYLLVCVASQATQSLVLSKEEALTRALERNLGIKIERARVDLIVS
jgi:hypothetical protein